MDRKNALERALIHGIIEGNENEVANDILSCNEQDFELLKLYLHFPGIIAALWRNEEVISHVGKTTTFSLDMAMEIHRRVEWTPEEIHELFEDLVKRVPIERLNPEILRSVKLTQEESLEIFNAAFKHEEIRKAANQLLLVDNNSLAKISEEVWKVVLSRD